MNIVTAEREADTRCLEMVVNHQPYFSPFKISNGCYKLAAARQACICFLRLSPANSSYMNRSIASKLILQNPGLPRLATCKSMTELKQIHAQIFRTGLSEDKQVSTKIIEICALLNPPNAGYACLVFNGINAPTTSLFNSMLRAYSRARNYAGAIDFYTRMLKHGCKPSGFTLCYVSQACTDSRSSRALMEIHGQAFKQCFDSDIVVANSLVRGYSVCGLVDSARQVFDELPERDLISWTVLLNSYVRSNRAREAVDLFFLIREENVRPDEVTIVGVFNACSQLGDLNLGRKLEDLAQEFGIDYNCYVVNSLIDMYAKCGSIGEAQKLFDKMVDKNVVSWNSMVSGYARGGDMESARRVFDQMPDKNSISWSALLNGYAQNGAFNEALAVFQEMRSGNVKANDAAISGAIAACAHLGALEMGRSIHDCLDERKVRSDVVLGTALVDMYGKCGCVEVARALFDLIENKNLASYNAMMMSLAVNGNAGDCLGIFSKMLKNGIRPDSISFVGVLSACAHAGWLKEATQYFNQMRVAYGIVPRSEHYSCMVHLLGHAGLVGQAYNFIISAPVKADVVMWGTLLNACKLHGNIYFGELAAKQIIGLEPSHGGAHVLLSSIYAAAHRWTEVMEVRKKMKDIGIGKRPGWSSIEIDCIVHEFLVGDDSHSEIKEIYSILSALHLQMYTSLVGEVIKLTRVW